MNCPECGVYLSFHNRRCDKCNADLTSYRRLWSISNQYYNDGLNKAKVRDLSGAIQALKISLQMDKTNTNARNLLGLVYYEMGETVNALSEWVLSKNYQEHDNMADYYMNKIQDNPNKLHNTNQIIKKYNYALSQAKGGNLDVALLQLKKVVVAQPNYVAAQQLLALVYMHSGDNNRAVKCLRKAQKIDLNNTRTLYYLSELGVNIHSTKVEKEVSKKIEPKGKALEKAEDPKFFSAEPELRDGKISKWSLVHILIGVIVGVLAVFFLVVPTIEKSIASKYNSEMVAMAEEQMGMSSNIQTLVNDKKDLEKTISNLKAKIKRIKAEAVDESLYDNLFKGISLYCQGEEEAAAEILVKLDISVLDSKSAKSLYGEIKAEIFPEMSEKKYKEATSYYNVGNYEESKAVLELALKYDESNTDAMYYLGRTYQRLENEKLAKKWYKKIINEYPSDYRVGEATRRLEEMEIEE